MRFHLVDVFAERAYAGNQLAVVESLGELTEEKMQQIAAEMNYSETTFIESFDERDVRIFTPNEEIPFAGHPTLGTASVIQEQTDVDNEIDLRLPVGRIPVRAERDGDREHLWMTQQSPEFGDRLDPETLTEVLSLTADDLGDDEEYPIQVVSTGLPTIIVPLAHRSALERIELDRQAYDSMVEDREAKNVLAFCTEPSDDADLAVRVFAPYYGVPEDPATGSSNGCLAGYLASHGDSERVDLRVNQGDEMGRPSRLHLRADSSGTVEIGGRVIPVARGELV
ncbi:PhzF family phenazine biosynthesis protein [Halocatena marina]|uniref:PhzF family phenazine biosynthesis protein n=1 Tax=Halocatena marina TaxID=2934937 RepID=A0ABD5YW98_9EURY|nr:PhzF family phenazine biosynthesis protein [Halocatena marina]